MGIKDQQLRIDKLENDLALGAQAYRFRHKKNRNQLVEKNFAEVARNGVERRSAESQAAANAPNPGEEIFSDVQENPAGKKK